VMMFKDGKSGKLLYSFEERVAMLEQFNVKFVLAIDYNEEFKQIAPLDFLASVENQINVKAYMSGKDFRFGAGAKGKSSTLKSYAEDDENGVWYQSVKDVMCGNDKVSTTLIKSCLDAGNVARASELLDSEFSVTGEAVHSGGSDSPVIITYPKWKYPVKNAVYSVKCQVGEFEYPGTVKFALNNGKVQIHAYLEGYSGDLHEQTVTVKFVDFISDSEDGNASEEVAVPEKKPVKEKVAEKVVVEAQPAEEVVTEEVVAEEQPVEETVTEEVVAEEQPVEEAVTEEVVVEAQPTEEEVPEETAEEVAEEEQKDDGETKID
ncbi:MAG: hypothetical protein K2O67_02590, partial [Clostridia bacterium]|nr:hypothetical protein [Clostridia bacterium]